MCFPISLTILILIFAWPAWVLNFLFGEIVQEFSIAYTVFSVLVNIGVVALVGFLVDKSRKNSGFVNKKYIFKFPLLLIVISLLLYFFTFIDKSCA